MYVGMEPSANKTAEEAAARERLWRNGWGRD
jgi:hypothetical protein